MINIYICDDNRVILDKFEALIKSMAEKNGALVHITSLNSAEQLLFDLSESPNKADIIYLDVSMGRMNGVEAANKLRELGCNAEIIFISSSKDHVFEAFDCSPLYYFLKQEISTQKFESVFLKAVDRCSQKEKDLFICESSSVSKQISLDSISHFEVRNRVVTVFYGNESFDFYSSMDKLEKELSEKGFIRTHRSFMINLKYIDKIQKDSITLIGGETIPMGSTYSKKIKMVFSKFLTYKA